MKRDPAITARELFGRLEALMPEAIGREFGNYQGCILATRIAVEVGLYFGIAVMPVPCRVILYNAIFAERIGRGEKPEESWFQAGAHSVGFGFGAPEGGGWNGHLVAAAGGLFADFTISQGERPARGIITGAALIGPYRPPMWKMENQHGTVIEYQEFSDHTYRTAPDWREAGRRRRISGPIIRELQGELLCR